MSPWNEIDDFIMKLATPGTIHHWVYYEQSETIVYVIQGYRRICLGPKEGVWLGASRVDHSWRSCFTF